MSSFTFTVVADPIEKTQTSRLASSYRIRPLA
jgi:hypothetical protein